MISYPEQLDAVRARIAELNVGLLFLPPGANLFYLTGIRRREIGGTDHNTYGDYVVGGYIGLNEGITILAPRMGGKYYETEAQDKPLIEEVRLIHESESPTEVLRQVLGRMALQGKRIMLDDRAWAQSVVAFRHLALELELALASEILAPMRMIKSEDELTLMRQAGTIAEEAFSQALARLKAGGEEG